jgi:hypothetical protein
MSQEIIKYNRISNYLAIVFWLLIMIILRSDNQSTISVGSFFDSALLYTAILFLWIILNSNEIFSTSFLIKYSLGLVKMKEHQLKVLETNYYVVFSSVFILTLGVISYLLIKYSQLEYFLIALIVTVFIFIMMLYHMTSKKKIIAKVKKIK